MFRIVRGNVKHATQLLPRGFILTGTKKREIIEIISKDAKRDICSVVIQAVIADT